jgi:hypothetical protein
MASRSQRSSCLHLTLSSFTLPSLLEHRPEFFPKGESRASAQDESLCLGPDLQTLADDLTLFRTQLQLPNRPFGLSTTTSVFAEVSQLMQCYHLCHRNFDPLSFPPPPFVTVYHHSCYDYAQNETTDHRPYGFPRYCLMPLSKLLRISPLFVSTYGIDLCRT